VLLQGEKRHPQSSRVVWLKGACACCVVVTALHAVAADRASSTADQAIRLTRESPWTLVSSVSIPFRTYHPQGLVKIGNTFFASSVEVRNRAAGEGVGHLFKFDERGTLLKQITLGEGAMYHPGGLDFDETHIWVAVAEYRPDSRAIVYRVDPSTMTATEVLRVTDHLGAIVHDVDDHSLYGISWGSRRFYRWPLRKSGKVSADIAMPRPILNPSHYVDYQDCKYAGRHRMLCTGVTEMRTARDASPFRLGGIELVDLRDARPIHQVPLLRWTDAGVDLTHNPVWLEATPSGLRGYFMPEDENSRLYILDVTLK
jgi:uncharacterized protein DUF6454